MWGLTATDLPLIGWYVLVLVFLEGLLSADNALVLAVMVRHLPRAEQRRALRYGIWGAFIFRLIAVLLSSVLIKFWLFKLIGGLYLVYLAIAHFVTAFVQRGHQGAEAEETGGPNQTSPSKQFGRGFWGTVISVELVDLAAVAMSDDLPDRFGDKWKLAVVYIGGILGILTMRFVAGYFILLLDRFRGLANGAYFLVAWIGLKLVSSGLSAGGVLSEEMPPQLFWLVMLIIAVASFVFSPRSSDPKRDEETST